MPQFCSSYRTSEKEIVLQNDAKRAIIATIVGVSLKSCSKTDPDYLIGKYRLFAKVNQNIHTEATDCASSLLAVYKILLNNYYVSLKLERLWIQTIKLVIEM